MHDPMHIADLADLRYVTDEEPGISRVRRGRGFSYAKHNGGAVVGSARERIKSLAIPPAWEKVWICTDPRGHIQATGRDKEGRKQYRYHPDWEAMRDEVKFDRMAPFGAKLPRLRKLVESDLRQRGLPRTRVVALAVAVLDQTLIRVGNDRYARQNGSFGLTTITGEHADIAGQSVQLSFIGKGGAQSDVALRNRKLANLVADCQELGGQNLFSYRTPDGGIGAVRSDDINDYLRAAMADDVTAKDFRTWGGSALLTEELGRLGPTEKPEKELLAAIDRVAELLGNTRAVCRASYLHPAVADTHSSGDLARIWAHSRSGRWMSRGESALLKVLGSSSSASAAALPT